MSGITRTDLVSLISTIIKENDKRSRTSQAEIFRKMVTLRGNDRYLRAILDAFFCLEYNRAYKAVFPPTVKEIALMAERRRMEDIEEEREVEIVKGIMTGRLLDLVTVSGKRLRDCTGAECLKLGGFFAAIGDRVGLAGIVGDVMTERDLRGLAESAWKITLPIKRAQKSGALRAA